MSSEEGGPPLAGPALFDQLERLMRLGWMAAGLAHDLNNALLCVLGELGILERQLDEARTPSGVAPLQLEQCDQTLARVRSAVATSIECTSDLLRLYRPRGEKPSRPAPRTDLLAAAGRAVNLARTRMRASLSLMGQERVEVAVDEATIARVLLNLLLNAEDAINSQGNPRGRIQVRVSRTGNLATCDVVDDGPGIDPEVLGRLFEPFVTTKPGGQGTGLGLAVSRTLLRGLGGDLTVRATGPGGSTFRVELPAVTDEPR